MPTTDSWTRSSKDGDDHRRRQVREAGLELDPLLDDSFDAMDDHGRSQSQHFMDLAKAYKKQAAHESKIHIQSFTSAMDIKAVSFTDLVDAKVKNIAESEERLKFLTDLLLQHDGEERKDHGTLCVKSITQTPAEDIVKSFEGFLKDYDNITQIFLPTERTLASLKPSYQDEELMQDVLRTQRSKTSQRVLALLHGDTGSFPANSGSLTASPQTDIWYENHEDMSAEMDEHAAHNWSSTAHSVSRGVRRLVRDFPMETKT